MVDSFEVTVDGIHGLVMGSEEYDVSISLVQGDVDEMSCSCPYARGGKHCKHMAAVLFAWSSQTGELERTSKWRIDNDEDFQSRLAEIDGLVEEADSETVRSFLKGVLAADERWYHRFCQTVKQVDDEDELLDYRLILDALVHEYAGDGGFIDYKEAGDFANELHDILDEDVAELIEKGKYRLAFAMANQLLFVLNDFAIDDSGGEIGMVADSIYETWGRLLLNADLEVKQEMFDWFVGQLDGPLEDYLQEYVEQMLIAEFNEGAFRQEKLQVFKGQLARMDVIVDQWKREYMSGKWAVQVLALLSKDEGNEQELKEVYQKYWNLAAVRRIAVKECMGRKDYARALAILDESLQLDRGKAGLVINYSQQKKEIYLLTGDKAAYVKQLWALVLEHDRGDFASYQELKEQYTAEEWVHEREKIFEQLPDSHQVARIYQAEGLKDRLLAYVVNSPDLFELKTFEDDLKEEYPRELLTKYRQELEKSAVVTSNWKQYAEYASILRHMKQLRGGAAEVAMIVDDWRKMYRNRRAMMEEIGKV